MTTEYPLYEFGGSGPVLNLALANGFPPETYRPLVEPLTEQYRVISLLPRALWPGARPPATLVNWRDMLAADLLAGLRHHNLRDVIAVGHSFGGVATLIAAGMEPERFRGLALLDVTILPRTRMRIIQWTQRLRLDWLNRMAARASIRRDHFPDEQAAFDYFRSKPLFADWSDDALRHYTATLQPNTRGELTLAWPREWEAYYFLTLYTGAWSHLSLLPASLPLLMLRGEQSNTLLPNVAAEIRRLLPHMTYAEIAGHGHLFPHSAPDATRQQLMGWLEQLAGR